MKIGFLYFHHMHHVFHSLPIAYELSSLGFSVDLIITSQSILKTISGTKNIYPKQSCNIVFLKAPFSFRYFNISKKIS